ncbi:hypothetical protein BD94_1409 [Elizabethkingia anophelis NUHP1]|uniref:Uncharacterized protein n=1 Tax=Elizabethkingia anophelis NUHP1 TaxID=1338011 RepID=A0A077EG99_9FLAO|nr:hypothetical protein BD94_1409 [Elizabethkingia anophelis NUHP1]
MKKEYIPPKIEVVSIELEQGLAIGSVNIFSPSYITRKQQSSIKR